MVQCETCKVWQHGLCMGYESEDQLHDDDYYCEQCRPEMHTELLKYVGRYLDIRLFLITVRPKETVQTDPPLLCNIPSQLHCCSIPPISFTFAIISLKTTIQTPKYNEQ
jgi:PHD-finger